MRTSDIDLSTLPLLIFKNAESIVSYLLLIDSKRFFASTIFKILVDNRRTAHEDRINNSRNIVMIYPGDHFMDHTTVQSDKYKDNVAQLCYSGRGLFQIILETGSGSHTLRQVNKPDSPEFKFMSEDLYILSPLLKPCELVDSSDTCYLNQSYAPVVNSLYKNFKY